MDGTNWAVDKGADGGGWQEEPSIHVVGSKPWRYGQMTLHIALNLALSRCRQSIITAISEVAGATVGSAIGAADGGALLGKLVGLGGILCTEWFFMRPYVEGIVTWYV
jgi:hypothetical protein